MMRSRWMTRVTFGAALVARSPPPAVTELHAHAIAAVLAVGHSFQHVAARSVIGEPSSLTSHRLIMFQLLMRVLAKPHASSMKLLLRAQVTVYLDGSLTIIKQRQT